MPRNKKIIIRNGTNAQFDAQAGTERMEPGEIGVAFDTSQIVVGTATPGSPLKIGGAAGMVKVGTAWIGGDQTGNTRGAGSLDVQASRSSNSQVAAGTGSICVGIGCRASGANSRAFGSFVDVPVDNTLELGMWSFGTRYAGVRMIAATGQVSFTVQTRSIPYVDGGSTSGPEPVNSLGRGMAAIRWSGSGLFIDYNNGGTIVTREIGGGGAVEPPAGP